MRKRGSEVSLTIFTAGLENIKALANSKSVKKSDKVYFWDVQGGGGVAAIACTVVPTQVISVTNYLSVC